MEGCPFEMIHTRYYKQIMESFIERWMDYQRMNVTKKIYQKIETFNLIDEFLKIPNIPDELFMDINESISKDAFIVHILKTGHYLDKLPTILTLAKQLLPTIDKYII